LKIHEVSTLTLGENKITSDNVIAFTRFSGGNALIINFFKRYLTDSSIEVLEGFVKFATGLFFSLYKLMQI